MAKHPTGSKLGAVPLSDPGASTPDRRQLLIPHDDGSVILIDYYQGACGPTLRIDIQRPDGLARLRNLFGTLADAKVQHANIDEVGQVKLSGVTAILLHLWPHMTEPRKLVELVRRGSEKGVVHWRRYSEGWREWAELLDGLKGPGHQYLTGKDPDDAMIEVSFLERPATPVSMKELQ